MGIRYEDFLNMTPRIFNVYVKAENQKNQTACNNMLTQAYLTAGWVRTKRMPDLNKILQKQKAKSKTMTDEQMLDQIKKLNKSHGGGVIGGSKEN